MRLLIALCFAMAMTSAQALAQAPAAAQADPAVAQLARDYVTLGGSEDLFLEGARYGFREAARTGGVTFTPTQRERINAIVDQHFRDAATVYVSQLTTFYSNNHNAEDLTAALSFYRSPSGQHYVGASVHWSFPLAVYLMTNGRAPLAHVDEAPSQDGLTLARTLAGRLIAQLHESDRVALAGAPIGIAGVTEYIARTYAVELTNEDIQAAIDWTHTEAAGRLEGPSAERTLAIQTATTLAMRAVDIPALQMEVLEALRTRESPA